MKTILLLSTSLLLLTFVGCGGPAVGATMYPTTGVVTMDGQPVAGAAVTFLSAEGTPGSGAYGRTDETGKYELTTLNGGKGAAAGKYNVVISKIVMADGSPIPPETKSIAELQTKNALPPKYNNPMEPQLTATVTAGGGPINFDLKSR